MITSLPLSGTDLDHYQMEYSEPGLIFAGRIASWWGQPWTPKAHLSEPQARWHSPHKTTTQPPWLLEVRSIACKYFTSNFVKAITEIKLVSLYSQTMGFSRTRSDSYFPLSLQCLRCSKSWMMFLNQQMNEWMSGITQESGEEIYARVWVRPSVYSVRQNFPVCFISWNFEKVGRRLYQIIHKVLVRPFEASSVQKFIPTHFYQIKMNLINPF